MKARQRYIDSAYVNLPNCKRETKHVFKLYKIQTKLYSLSPIGTSKSVSIVREDCQTMRKLKKSVENQLLENYEKSCKE